MSYVYIKSEPDLFTVGFYDPKGEWVGDTDHESRDEAADRVAFLNGAQPNPRKSIDKLATRILSFNGEFEQSDSKLMDEAWNEYCMFGDTPSGVFGMIVEIIGQEATTAQQIRNASRFTHVFLDKVIKSGLIVEGNKAWERMSREDSDVSDTANRQSSN